MSRCFETGYLYIYCSFSNDSENEKKIDQVNLSNLQMLFTTLADYIKYIYTYYH